MKKYLVELSAEQREELLHMISTGRAAARELTHACILLKADQGPQGPAWSDSRIQEALEVSANTVQRVRKCCAQRGGTGSHCTSSGKPDASPLPGRDTRSVLDCIGL
jgi:hypothetical protein